MERIIYDFNRQMVLNCVKFISFFYKFVTNYSSYSYVFFCKGEISANTAVYCHILYFVRNIN